MKYSSTLVKKEEVAEGTMMFHFKKPEGFDYKAGQNCDFTVIDPIHTDNEGNTRAFSLASAPYEEDLYIATRMRDTAFKNSLKEMETVQLELDGPMGSFTLHSRTEKPAVFLIGGIGITPVYSMIKDALYRKSGHTMYLLYSNRTPEDAAFFKELQALANASFVFVPTMTNIEDGSWGGETGYIDANMIEKHVPNSKDAIIYIAGPQTMVTAMRKVVSDMGIVDDDIRTEEFAGY